MSSPCREMERALKRGQYELPEMLRKHAEECPACSNRLRSWRDISEAAPALRKTWESPDLRERIRLSLADTSGCDSGRPSCHLPWWKKVPALGEFRRPALAGILLLVLTLVGIRSLLYRYPAENENPRQLLTEQALREIETTEQAYLQSLEKLSGLPQIKHSSSESPLLTAYREKLMVIDEAIAECRAHIERNRFNAYLRQELLVMYREKQNTLKEILEEGRHAEN